MSRCFSDELVGSCVTLSLSKGQLHERLNSRSFNHPVQSTSTSGPSPYNNCHQWREPRVVTIHQGSPKLNDPQAMQGPNSSVTNTNSHLGLHLQMDQQFNSPLEINISEGRNVAAYNRHITLQRIVIGVKMFTYSSTFSDDLICKFLFEQFKFVYPIAGNQYGEKPN